MNIFKRINSYKLRWILFGMIGLFIFLVIAEWLHGHHSTQRLSFFDFLSGNLNTHKSFLQSFLSENIVREKRPICLRKTEKKCRNIVENLFKCPFPSVRPDFLKYPISRKNLELDMFNPELKVAFEYQGRQHREYTPYYHSCVEDFTHQKERDLWKEEKCKQEGICLIVIPDTVKTENLEEFIVQKCKEQKLLM